MTINETIEEGMFQADNPIHQLTRMLIRYDLTPNQAKVYLFLSKIGIKTASEVSKSLTIPRTETYHLLSTLQQKGIIFSIFGKPTKFNAVGVAESLEILVNNERNRINELDMGRKSILKLWDIIPTYGNVEQEQENKFQSLQGRNSILVKLEQMVRDSEKNILVLGTDEDFKRFYFTEFAELLNKTKSDLKVLIEHADDTPHIFDEVDPKKIKRIDDKNREEFCFIIKDDKEVIFFISNNKQVKDMLAVWTDSKAFVTTLRSLFSLLWKKSHYFNETNAESLLGSEITYEHRLREIEQEKIILSYLQENFQIIGNGKGNKK
jgi:sugar-specific transcriptional regulator TrmB